MRVTRLLCLLLLLTPMALGAAEYQRVEVQDPYLDLFTGPGRGFPAAQVVERGEWIDILLRKTDWFKVRTENGIEGWVDRDQMERTLTEAGVGKSFRDVLLDDYLARRLEIGFAAGQFDGDPVLATRASYRLNDYFITELSVAQVSGRFSSTKLYDLNLQLAPYADRRFSPYFNLGIGRFNNDPRATLVNNQKVKATAAIVGAGLRVHLSRRFIVRFDFKDYVVMVDTDRNQEFKQWVGGFSFFF